MSNTEEMRKLINLYENMSVADVVADINSSKEPKAVEATIKKPEVGDAYVYTNRGNGDPAYGKITKVSNNRVYISFDDGDRHSIHMDFFDFPGNDFDSNQQGKGVTWDSINQRWVSEPN